MNILVIKLGALGDFILALGAMEAIRRHHKDARITLLTTKAFKDMAARSGYFDDIILDTRPRFYDVKGWTYLFRALNKGGFTRVYDLQMVQRTAIYYRLFLSKPEWSGAIKGLPLCLTHPDFMQWHAFKRHQEVLKLAGIEAKAPDTTWMQSDVHLFKPKEPYVLFVAGSAPTHPEKRWPAVRYAALAMKLIRQGYQVALLGTPAEHDVIDTIVRSCPEVIDLSGRTSLYDVATLARSAVAAVGNDTGPMHLIAVSGCPSLVLFSASSHPEQSAPLGKVSVLQCDDLAQVTVDEVFKNMRFREDA